MREASSLSEPSRTLYAACIIRYQISMAGSDAASTPYLLMIVSIIPAMPRSHDLIPAT